MKPTTKKLLIVGAIVAPFLIGFAIISILIVTTFFGFIKGPSKEDIERANKQIQDIKKQTTETVGTIVNKSVSGMSNTSSGSTTLYYQFVVDGKTYHSQKRADSTSQNLIGFKVRVCYEPSNPENSGFFFAEENKTCGQ